MYVRAYTCMAMQMPHDMYIHVYTCIHTCIQYQHCTYMYVCMYVLKGIITYMYALKWCWVPFP